MTAVYNSQKESVREKALSPTMSSLFLRWNNIRQIDELTTLPSTEQKPTRVYTQTILNLGEAASMRSPRNARVGA